MRRAVRFAPTGRIARGAAGAGLPRYCCRRGFAGSPAIASGAAAATRGRRCPAEHDRVLE